MCVGKGRVDLDGTGVALQGALNVLHLLQGVAHVTDGERGGEGQTRGREEGEEGMGRRKASEGQDEGEEGMDKYK